jgi:UDP-3-O-[3-hydroxymyristoyl] glucosamine N-acyltransferase
MEDILDILNSPEPQPPRRVSNLSKVSNTVIMEGESRVVGAAVVEGNVTMRDNSVIGGFAKVYGGEFLGNVKVGGTAVIYGGVWTDEDSPIVEGIWDGPRRRRAEVKKSNVLKIPV